MRFAALVALIATASAAAEERPRVAVLGLQAKNVDANVVATLTGLLGTEITRLEQYQVLSEDDVRGLLAATRLAALLGCEGEACAGDLSQVGQQLNAGQLVTGAVGSVGSKFLLNLTLLDAKTSKVENRASVEAPSLDELPATVRRGVLALFGIAGQIALWNQVEGAQVFLNEKLIGVAPVKKIDVKREGDYTVRVYRDDYTPFEKTVAVKAGEIVRVKVDSYGFRELEEWSDGRKSWGYGLMGAGGLVTVGGGVLWAMAFRSNQQLDGLDLRRPDHFSRAQEVAATTFNTAMGAIAATAVGLGVVAAGGWMIMSNPWQERLEQFAVAPAPDGTLVAYARF